MTTAVIGTWTLGSVIVAMRPLTPQLTASCAGTYL
jgi:hypothetical protein